MAHLKSLLLLAALCLSGLACAGPLPLWEIEGTSNRVILLGSVHYLRQSDYPLPSGMTAAYDIADELVMEIDMDDLNQTEAALILTQVGSSENASLRDSLTAAGYAEAQKRAADIGVPLEMFAGFEPWFAALTVSQMRLLQMGFDPNWGIETQLLGKAAADGKAITGLETMAEQLGFLDRMSAKDQEDFLLQSLEDDATLRAQITEIVAAWHAGDMAELENIMLEGFESAPGLEQAVLVERNRNWIADIMDLRNRPNNYLVVVGTMHLVGDNSVVAMLEDRGIRVRQMQNDDF